MTKRMLSLLLALVMTLSLCVPALAADEFEAETVTEVVEQAPEAPVEPEAPEAEVVEEPAAEEEPVEAPEVAAALVEEEEEDLPLLVKLGVVTKEAHYRLYNDVNVAKTYKAGVEAGTLRSANFDLTQKALNDDLANYAKDPVAYDPFKNATGDVANKKDFLSVLAKAEKALEGVDGVEIADVTVNTAYLDGIASELEKFLPGGEAELVDHTYDADEEVELLARAELTTLIKNNWHKHYDDITIQAEVEGHTALTAATKDVTLDAEWKKAYQMNYLEALEEALEAYSKLTDSWPNLKYATFKAATKAAMDALVLEREAWKPGDAEETAVKNALAAAPSNKNIYDTTRFALGTSAGVTSGQTYDSFKGEGGYWGALNALLSDKTTATVKFNPGTTLWEVNDKLETLKNYTKVAGDPTLAYVQNSAKVTAVNADNKNPTEVQIKFTLSEFPGSKIDEEIVDGYQYAIAWHVKHVDGDTVTDQWYNGSAYSAPYVEGTAPANDYMRLLLKDGGLARTVTSNNAKTVYTVAVTLKDYRNSIFDPADKVTVHVYKNENIALADSIANGKWQEIDKFTFDVGVMEKEEDLDFGKIGSAYYGVVGTPWTIAKYNKDAKPDTLVKQTGLIGGGSETKSYVAVNIVNSDGGATIDVAKAKAAGYAIRLALLDSAGKPISVYPKDKPLDFNIANHIGQNFWVLTAEEDAALKAGTYDVLLQCSKLDDNGKPDGNWVNLENSKAKDKADGTIETFTIGKLNAWDATEKYNQYSYIKPTTETTDNYAAYALGIVKAAKALKQEDYRIAFGKGQELEGATEEAQIAGGFGLIDKAITAMTALLSDSSAGSTLTNHNKICAANNGVVNSVGDILYICKNLEKKSADFQNMVKLLEEAEGKVGKSSVTEDEGTGKYTFNTYGKLKVTMKEAEALYAQGKEIVYQHEVNAIEKELRADIDALADMATIDKTQLEASIKAAEACKEADYTVATWRPFKAALDVAKKVLADEKATQAQLTNAAEVLTAAYNKLVMTDEAKAAKELAAAKEALAAAVKAAEEYKEADYTAESWKTFKDALDNAKALGDSATKADVEAAQKALEAAEKALEKKPATTPDDPKPTIPAAPASGTGWVKATDGTWYYYKDKVLQKSKWIYGKGGLWYYVDADAKMLTGFQKIGNAWFMLQTGTEGGTQGKLVTSKNGWINDPAIPGDAYARTDRNSGHFGEITWTAAYGDFVNGHFTKGDPAA